MPFKFATAKSHLTEADRDRIVCLYLCSDKNKINNEFDWETATTAYGSASAESMKVSLRNTLKKLDKALGDEMGANSAGADTDTNKRATPPVTPSGGRKRRANAGADGEDDESIAVAAPKAKKGRGGKKIKREQSAESENAEAPVKGNGKEGVKEEVDDEAQL